MRGALKNTHKTKPATNDHRARSRDETESQRLWDKQQRKINQQANFNKNHTKKSVPLPPKEMGINASLNDVQIKKVQKQQQVYHVQNGNGMMSGMGTMGYPYQSVQQQPHPQLQQQQQQPGLSPMYQSYQPNPSQMYATH